MFPVRRETEKYFPLFCPRMKKSALGFLAGEGILIKKIVSDVSRLHLDFILCDDSLQYIYIYIYMYEEFRCKSLQVPSYMSYILYVSYIGSGFVTFLKYIV